MRNILLLIATAFALGAQVKITPGNDRVTVEIDGKPFTTYYLAVDGNKPHLYPLRTASGIEVTCHFPMEEAGGLAW